MALGNDRWQTMSELPGIIMPECFYITLNRSKYNMSRSAIAVLLLAPLVALGAEDDASKIEREEIQGTWLSVKGYKANGDEVAPDSIKNHRMVINGDKMTNSIPGKPPVSFKITTDASKSPNEIDWIIREGAPPRLGIYRVNGDALEIAWGGPNDGRPTALTPCPKGSPKRWTYGIYAREKD
jgi:uncharacterized protein (TIGR03067 family)